MSKVGYAICAAGKAILRDFARKDRIDTVMVADHGRYTLYSRHREEFAISAAHPIITNRTVHSKTKIGNPVSDRTVVGASQKIDNRET